MAGRREGEQGVKEGSNFEDAWCRGMENLGEYGSFTLAIAVGNETP